MKNFLIKLTIFFVVIIVLQYVIGNYFYPSSPPESVNKLRSFQQKNFDVIYFGDSSVTWYGKYDKNEDSTAKMLDTLLPDKYQVGEITHNSYHAGIYNAYTNYMVQQHYNPKYIIMPINLRSFSAEWDLRAGSQFTGEILYLNLYNTYFNALCNFLINFSLTDVNRIYDNIFALAPIYDGEKVVGYGGGFESQMNENTPENIRFRKMLQMFYLGKLNKNHRKLQDLITIAKRYEHTDTTVVYYLTPLDYQLGEKYFGKRFTTQVKQNIATIKNELKKYNVIILDLSYSQPTQNFIWHETWYINEHLNEKGRNYIANQLKNVLINDKFK